MNQAFSTTFSTASKYFNIDEAVGQARLKDDGEEDRALFSDLSLDNDNSGKISLAVIEFDDEGGHWDSRQSNNALAEVERILFPASDNSKQTETESAEVFLVVYVHGWRANASEANVALSQFRWFVSKLARHESICYRSRSQKSQKARETGEGDLCEARPHVFGVFISWRGDALGTALSRIPGVEYLTFWNRRAAAQRVASSAMTETLLGLFERLEAGDRKRIEAWKSEMVSAQESHDSKGALSIGRSPPRRSRSLVIGHSMGALILERAFAQAFLAKRVESRRMFEEQLVDELAQLKTAKESLNETKKQLVDLRRRYQATKLRGNNLGLSIGVAKGKVVGLKEQLGDIDVTDAETRRLQMYADMVKPKFDGSVKSCAAYSKARVKKCTGDSADLRVVSDCAAREIRCIYESYRCSIERLLSRSPNSLRISGCVSAIQLRATVPKTEQIQDWEQFEKDLVDRKTMLDARLVNPWEGVPNSRDGERDMAEILNDEHLFDGGKELRASIIRWLNVIKPWTFKPRSPGFDDVTEEDEDTLLEQLETAEKDLGGRLASGVVQLSALERDWLDLREKRQLLAKKRNMNSKSVTLKSRRSTRSARGIN